MPDDHSKEFPNFRKYAITGVGNRWDNIGAMMNRGVEIAMDGDVIRTKDLTLTY